MDLILALPIVGFACGTALLLYSIAAYVLLMRKQTWSNTWRPQVQRFLDSRTAMPMILFGAIATTIVGLSAGMLAALVLVTCINQATLAKVV